MAKPKKTAEATDSPAKASAAKAPTPRYKYTGPNVARLDFPGLRFAFRPALLTDNQITGILKQYPQMIRYFDDSQSTAE